MERATILRSEEDIFLLRRTLYCGQSTYLVKMRMNIGFLVGTFGVLFLPHAAYYTIQYKALLKITQEEFSGPPFDVVIKLIIGLLLCMWAALTVPGKFLSIHPQSDENRVVAQPENLDFMIFNHRGKAFPQEVVDFKLKRHF